VETGEPGGKPPGRRRLTIRLQTSFGLGTRLWLWLDVSHLNSNLSKKTSSGRESCSIVRGPTGSSSHSRLCVLQGETSGEVCLSRRQETLFTRRGDRRQGPGQELACLRGSSAARSSLVTILLLLPVFGPRPGNVIRTAGSGLEDQRIRKYQPPTMPVRVGSEWEVRRTVETRQ